MSSPRPLLIVSDRAQSRIRTLMSAHGAENASVRVYAELAPGGKVEIGLAFDEKRDSDVEVSASGLSLVADPRSLALSSGRRIDFGTDGFTFVRENGCESLPITEY